MTGTLGHLFVTSIAVIVALPCSAYAQASFDFSPLEKAVLAEMQQSYIPGAAVAVVSGDRVVFAKGFGVANIETNEQVTADMLFRLGSTTKMFTAAALVMLAEQGKLRLDQPLGNYIKGIDPAIAALTAHQVLSHTAGFWDEAPMYGSHDDSSLATEIRGWKADRLFAAPGVIYSYANPGYWFAGLAIEELSGKPFADQLSESLFKPLGMNRSTFRPFVAMTYPLAQGHDVTPRGVQSVVRPFANNVKTWAAGSMFSSVTELARFAIAFMNEGRLDGKQVLSSSLIAILSTTHAKIPGQDAGYGYGLQTSTYRGVRIVEHGGARSGYGSTIRMVPEQKFAVIAIANRSGAALPRTLEAAMEIALKLEPRQQRVAPNAEVMTEAEMDRHVGTYANGNARVAVIKEGGKLYVRPGAPRYEAVKLADDRYVVIAPSGNRAPFAFVRGTEAQTEYLYFGGRSFRRKQE